MNLPDPRITYPITAEGIDRILSEPIVVHIMDNHTTTTMTRLQIANTIVSLKKQLAEVDPFSMGEIRVAIDPQLLDISSLLEVQGAIKTLFNRYSTESLGIYLADLAINGKVVVPALDAMEMVTLLSDFKLLGKLTVCTTSKGYWNRHKS